MGTSVSTCRGCGAEIIFAGGQETVKCEYCGLVNTRPEENADYIETNAESLIKRAYILLENGNFQHAMLSLQMALNLEPENTIAYIGLLMAEVGAKTEANLISSPKLLTQYSSYSNALRFADPEQKAKLEKYAQQVEERIDKKDKRTIRTIVILVGSVSAVIIILVGVSFYNIMAVGAKLSQQEAATSRVFETEIASQPTPEASKVNPAVSGGEFTFKSDDVYNSLSTDNDNVKFTTRNEYSYPEYIADWSHAGSLRLVCYNDPVSGNVKAITLVCDASSINSSHGDAFLNYLMQILGLCNVPEDFSEISSELGLSNFTRGPDPVSMNSSGVGINVTWNDEDAFFVIYPESTGLDIGSLPIKIDRPPDFFTDDARRKAYKELNENFQFSEILAMANEYIAQNNPAETDSAYAIAEQAQAGLDAMESCTIVKDEFEGDLSIYYNGVEKLSSEINFLPYIDDHSDTILVGFTASDWLFFNTVYIKADDEMVEQSHFKDTAMTQEVTDNGIYEDISITLSQDDIDKILNSENTMIRFENDETDKTKDHTITENEKNALRTIRTVESAYGTLKSLCYHWEND